MSYSLYTMVSKLRFDQSIENKIKQRIDNCIDTGLRGFENEKVIYEPTDEIKTSLEFIKDSFNSIDNSRVAESIIIESFGSATIEGAKTSIENINKNRYHPITKSDKMVCNVLDCIEKYKEITNTNIREIWETLVSGVCENKNADGDKYRSGMVYIGNELNVIHISAEPDSIDRYMNDLFRFSSNNNGVISAVIIHWYIAYVHPFCDGNGRLARLWQYYKLDMPGLPVSESISSSVGRYYKVLKHSDFTYKEIIDITCFIEYMLECISSSIKKALVHGKMDKLEYKIFSKTGAGGITVTKLVKNGYSESSVKKAFLNLVDKGYMVKVKDGKEYRYFRVF